MRKNKIFGWSVSKSYRPIDFYSELSWDLHFKVLTPPEVYSSFEHQVNTIFQKSKTKSNHPNQHLKVQIKMHMSQGFFAKSSSDKNYHSNFVWVLGWLWYLLLSSLNHYKSPTIISNSIWFSVWGSICLDFTVDCFENLFGFFIY